MMDRASRLDTLLGEIMKIDGALGAALVSRDGLCVRSAGRAELSRETFSAMSATVMGAAEIALRELDGNATRAVVASTDQVKILIVGATREMLLVAYATAASPLAPMQSAVEHTASEVGKVLGGG